MPVLVTSPGTWSLSGQGMEPEFQSVLEGTASSVPTGTMGTRGGQPGAGSLATHFLTLLLCWASG